jgi:hypothetical protein
MMSLETRKEKIIFLALVPVIAAVCGALATAIFTNTSCQLGPGTDFVTVLSNQALTGDQKLKALEIYQTVTDRPWGLVRSLLSILAVVTGALVFTAATRLGRK